MLKDSDIFNERERRLLYAKKPELRPAKVPSLKDANTIRVPSLNDVVLLEQPSVDQIIIEFLRQYEVNVKPRSVGSWNGWDTLSTVSALFAREGSTLNISSTMFMANRSNQVNSAAQDWGTWKRWALDHKNFEQYQEDVIQTINLHNEKLIKEVEEGIRKAKLHNKNAIKEVEESIRRAELHNENLVKKLQKQKIELKEYISQLIESENLQIEKIRKNTINNLVVILKKSVYPLFAIILILMGYEFISRPKLPESSRQRIQLMTNPNDKNALKARLYFYEGQLEFGGNDYKNAKYWYKKAIKLDKNLKGANYALGLTFYRIASIKGYGMCKAINSLNRVTNKDPYYKKANELLIKIDKLWNPSCNNFFSF